MSSTVTDLRGQLDERRKKLARVYEQAKSTTDEVNGQPFYDLTKAEDLEGDSAARVEQVRKMNAEIDELHAKVKEQDDLAAGEKRLDDLGTIDRAAIHTPAGGREPVVSRKSFGQLVVESDAFQGYKRGSRGVGPVAEIDVPFRATLFETGAGWAPESTRIGRVEFKPLRPAPHVVDFIPDFTTTQAAVVYMEETTHTDNTAEIAEAAIYGEAAFVLTERTKTVRKIGTWLPVTDEQLADEEGARDYIDNRLTYQLARRVDGQVLVGSGVAPNLEGTENVAGIQTQALGADPIFDAALKLFVLIESDGFADPSVFFIAPTKWQTVALTRTADGLYILGHPAQEAEPRLWGVPGVKTTAHTSTKLIAGDYTNYAGLYVRKGVEVQVGYQSDDFIKGRLAIRADVRVAMVHFRPKAFGVVTGL